MRRYFDDMVLPSVGLPVKGSYNIVESCKILCISRITLRRWISKKVIRVVEHSGMNTKRIYLEEFRKYFSQYDIGNNEEW